MSAIGAKCWAIPEGYIPSGSVSDEHALISHEAACILNTGEKDAEVTIVLYFEDHDPVGPYRFVVPARRTLHMRFNDLSDPEPVPRDTSYASIIRSTQPIVVQHTRLDSRHPHISLLSAAAFPSREDHG